MAAPSAAPWTQKDAARDRWFIDLEERGNRRTGLRAYTAGNLTRALIDGSVYFRRLLAELEATGEGDHVSFLDFRGDFDERLDGPGSEVASVLSAAADRGVLVFGLLWRSHPRWLHQSEEANAEFVKHVAECHGQVMLDGRTRRAGSHHQKLVVIRHPREPERDVAFVGGIDLGHSRRDDGAHAGDPQRMEFPPEYGHRPPWHDLQVEVRGPAVTDLDLTFRERWDDGPLGDDAPLTRRVFRRAYHADAMSGITLPAVEEHDSPPSGDSAVQVLRTYPARLRRYPFAPLGERGIAAAYRRAIPCARRLVYLEDQFFWSREAAELLAAALRTRPALQVVAVVPRYPDNDGPAAVPGNLEQRHAVDLCRRAGGDRFSVYDLENAVGTPVYVHAKVVIIDDVWAMVGSDNLNRRSWTHDSELSLAILDAERDLRVPADPGGRGDGARRFARDLRIALTREHLGQAAPAAHDLADPEESVAAMSSSAAALDAWYLDRTGPRPPGHLRRHPLVDVSRPQRLWAPLLARTLFDPDGRAWRDKIRRRG